MKHVVGVSGGKDSTALALRLMEVEPQDYDFLITPVGNELPEMEAHWAKLETLLGKSLIRLQPFGPGDGLLRLINHYKALPNWRQRWCTRQLKIVPTIEYLKSVAPAVQYVGLRADEEDRQGIYGEIEGVQQRFPFKEWGWGVADVWDYLAERGIRIPKRTDCAWCYGQRLIDWKRLWENHPDIYAEGEAIEILTGHTFRSPGRDTWPASLTELRVRFEAGKRVKGEKMFVGLDLFDQGEEEEMACRVCSL